MQNSFWNGLSFEEWTKESNKRWQALLNGESTILIPSDFCQIKSDFGSFIMIQSSCLLNEEPNLFVRSTYYKRALKVLVPKEIKAGDSIRIVRKSQSGKSYIAKIEESDNDGQ
jgi:hypothetical protein